MRAALTCMLLLAVGAPACLAFAPHSMLWQTSFTGKGVRHVARCTSAPTRILHRGARAGGLRGATGMFTGIVEEMGQVVALQAENMAAWDSPGTIVEGVTLTIAAKVALEGAYEGCSISVNGVCLTVTEFDASMFKVGCAPETLRLTNLGDLSSGSPVNLERAAAIDGRNSGHMVQGHVDNVGTIIEKWADNESLFIKVKAPTELMKYIVPKGFIAIDGTSLTVCEVNAAESWFTFMLIEYTQKHIIVPQKQVGDKVNLEVDVVSKYVERSLGNISERLDKIEKALGISVDPGMYKN